MESNCCCHVFFFFVFRMYINLECLQQSKEKNKKRRRQRHRQTVWRKRGEEYENYARVTMSPISYLIDENEME